MSTRTVADIEKKILELKTEKKAIIDANSEWVKDRDVIQAIRAYDDRITVLRNEKNLLLGGNPQSKLHYFLSIC